MRRGVSLNRCPVNGLSNGAAATAWASSSVDVLSSFELLDRPFHRPPIGLVRSLGDGESCVLERFRIVPGRRVRASHTDVDRPDTRMELGVEGPDADGVLL